jgi:DNA-binding NtrC family response regulator
VLLRVLLATGTPDLADRIESLLGGDHLLTSRVSNEEEVWESLARDSFDLVVTSEEVLPRPPSTLIQSLRQLPDRPEVIVVRQQEDPVRRARLLADGALAVLNNSVPDEVLAATLGALLERRRDSLTRRLSAEQITQSHRLSDFSTSSPAMGRLLDVARRVIAADTSLVIVGETGVGKEWLARAIHEEGPRARHQFIAVNCAAMPESLLESELFGHEKGSFTGAVMTRQGLFEMADGGTLFLDEIADMPLHLQAKLLRVLQDHSIQRLGAEAPIAIDVRIMAATNRELDRAMAEGSFRSDLYYRLSVVSLRVPPLRERREDIEPLALGYLRRFSDQFGRPLDGIEGAAVAALEAYAWPGNVRELINVMERAVLLCRGTILGLEDLPTSLSTDRNEPSQPAETGLPIDDPAWLDRPLAEIRRQAVKVVERRYLEAQLARHSGRIGETAHASGIDPRSLYDKMRRLGLRKEDFKTSP